MRPVAWCAVRTLRHRDYDLRCYHDVEAGQTVAVRLRAEESPGSTEQDAG